MKTPTIQQGDWVSFELGGMNVRTVIGLVHRVSAGSLDVEFDGQVLTFLDDDVKALKRSES